MYNAKIIQYPSGWQVRIYSRLVGLKDNRPDDWFLTTGDNRFVMFPVWDDNLGEYVYDRVPCKNPLDPLKDTWYNPFSERIEKMPVEYDEKQIESNKQRSLRNSMARTVHAVYHKARSNIWDWFVTLTFNPDLVDSLDYGVTVQKLSKWLNNLRRYAPDIGYIMVPEQHKSGRYHFHGLFRDCGDLDFSPSGKTDRKGNMIYNVGSYKLGWSTATSIIDQSRVTKYLAKYISKDLCQVAFGKKRYWASRNLQEAPVQEVILEPDKINRLVGCLDAKATYIRCFESGDIVTTFYELPKEATDEEIV